MIQWLIFLLCRTNVRCFRKIWALFISHKRIYERFFLFFFCGDWYGLSVGCRLLFDGAPYFKNKKTYLKLSKQNPKQYPWKLICIPHEPVKFRLKNIVIRRIQIKIPPQKHKKGSFWKCVFVLFLSAMCESIMLWKFAHT